MEGIYKKCSCGIEHHEIPSSARYLNDGSGFSGLYWECSCKSTLFYPLKKLMQDYDPFEWEIHYKNILYYNQLERLKKTG